MRFKEYIKNIPIKEAVIDTPRQTYATGVFDNADTNNPKLKHAIIDMVKKQIEEFDFAGGDYTTATADEKKEIEGNLESRRDWNIWKKIVHGD